MRFSRKLFPSPGSPSGPGEFLDKCLKCWQRVLLSGIHMLSKAVGMMILGQMCLFLSPGARPLLKGAGGRPGTNESHTLFFALKKALGDLAMPSMKTQNSAKRNQKKINK